MTSKKFAVLGDPITKSLSPKIHSAAYKALGLDWSYEAIKVESGGLARFLETADAISGFSVTMPLKYEAASSSIASDNAAASTGVVNTLVRSADGLLGFNTDVYGIAQAISGVQDVRSICISGSGATATSAIVAAKASFPSSAITLIARNAERRSLLADRFEVNAAGLSSQAPECDLLIDTIPESNIECKGVVLRTSYNSGEVPTLKFIPGTEMLLWQALAQIRIFLSGSPDISLNDEPAVLREMRLAISSL
jgi:shikimate dehydrogenase